MCLPNKSRPPPSTLPTIELAGKTDVDAESGKLTWKTALGAKSFLKETLAEAKTLEMRVLDTHGFVAGSFTLKNSHAVDARLIGCVP